MPHLQGLGAQLGALAAGEVTLVKFARRSVGADSPGLHHAQQQRCLVATDVPFELIAHPAQGAGLVLHRAGLDGPLQPLRIAVSTHWQGRAGQLQQAGERKHR